MAKNLPMPGIRVEFAASASHEEWAGSAIQVAARFGVCVIVEANMVDVVVFADDAVQDVVDRYRSAVRLRRQANRIDAIKAGAVPLGQAKAEPWWVRALRCVGVDAWRLVMPVMDVDEDLCIPGPWRFRPWWNPFPRRKARGLANR